MSSNTLDKDLKTLGIVLRRTNYAEADRILNLITPIGKVSAIAKGVRRPKSKLAGGVEMFTLSELQIHRGRTELGVVTSARMIRHFGNILKDYERTEVMALVLKRVSTAAERLESEEFFEIVQQVMAALDDGVRLGLVEGWFWLNLMKVGGEEMNLYRDADGVKLEAEKKYEWSVSDMAFKEKVQGTYGASEIKLLRLMVTMKLAEVRRIKVADEMLEKTLNLARVVAKK